MTRPMPPLAGDVIVVPNRLPALLQQALLPWEDADELATLLGELIGEFAPVTASQRHLVEQLALGLWRKRRVAQAEKALHLDTLRRQTGALYSDLVVDSARLAVGAAGKGVSLAQVLDASPTQEATQRAALDADEAATLKALAILRRGGRQAYARALAALADDTRAWWAELLAEEVNGAAAEPAWCPTAANLQRFLEEEVMPMHMHDRAQLGARQAIREQAHGQSLDPDRAGRLQGYELRLDRQIERTLGLLVKLCGALPAVAP